MLFILGSSIDVYVLVLCLRFRQDQLHCLPFAEVNQFGHFLLVTIQYVPENGLFHTSIISIILGSNSNLKFTSKPLKFSSQFQINIISFVFSLSIPSICSWTLSHFGHIPSMEGLRLLFWWNCFISCDCFISIKEVFEFLFFIFGFSLWFHLWDL